MEKDSSFLGHSSIFTQVQFFFKHYLIIVSIFRAKIWVKTWPVNQDIDKEI